MNNGRCGHRTFRLLSLAERAVEMREILNGIFYLLVSGCSWRMLPHEFPNWKTVYHCLRTGQADGTWERLLRERVDQQAAQHVFNTVVVQQGVTFIWLYLLAAQHYQQLAAYEQLLAELTPEFARRDLPIDMSRLGPSIDTWSRNGNPPTQRK